MKLFLVAGLLMVVAAGCASTSSLRMDERWHAGADEECLYYPYACADNLYPWYGLYPYDWRYYGASDYYYYPYHDRQYPYYLWRHRPDHKKRWKPWYGGEKRYSIGERLADIRKAGKEAREQRINKARQVREHRMEIRKERTRDFRSTIHRPGPGHGFKGGFRGGFGGFGRR